MSRAWVMGGFHSPEALLDALGKLRALGYGDLDAYTPFPVEGAEEALGLGGSRIPAFVLGGGLTGAVCGYLLQWYCNAYDFPINIGGRPAHSAPSFVPITFELTILLGAFGAFFGLFLLLKLPRLHHPVFNAPGFRHASVDQYWVSIGAGEDAATRAEIGFALQKLGAANISTVEGAP